jgi:two-component system phosphate regulon response regulator PhoB
MGSESNLNLQSKLKRVLVVEDERDVRDLMGLHLNREGLEVVSVENGEEGLRLLTDSRSRCFDLLVLDWMLPGLSGLEICKRLRHSSQATEEIRRIPILMVTARADTTDIILGLEMGADDYITKPFELPVFLARVRALLRRAEIASEAARAPEKKVEIAGLSINMDAYEVRCAGEPIELTPSEFRLLTAMTENRGRVLSRDRLIELVQGQGVAVGDRTIDTHVFGLRKKLGPCSEVIETIRGVGYRVKA